MHVYTYIIFFVKICLVVFKKYVLKDLKMVFLEKFLYKEYKCLNGTKMARTL